MLSYWEKKNFQVVDFVVIGAGIVGLSTAIQYKMKFPDHRVLVLERGIFPSGASSKNAGFACFGSLSEIADDLVHMDENEVVELVRKRFDGLQEIQRIFDKDKLDYHAYGGFELLRQEEMKYLDEMSDINALLWPIFDQPVFSLEKDPSRFGFSKAVKTVVKNRFEGQLDPGKFLEALWEKCQEQKIKILTGVEVTEVDLEMKVVHVASPSLKNLVTFSAHGMAICTNAFTKKLFPDVQLTPGRGLVLLTKPIQKLPWQGAFHLDRGYVYFRNIDGRLLIGGGRNLDVPGETTTEFGVHPGIQKYLMHLTEELIFPGQSVDYEMEWSGIMAFGETKKPIVRMITPQIGLAVRLGGMGVAIGWQVAKELVMGFDAL